MMPVWGIDGYRRGWLGVWIENEERGFALFNTATELIALNAPMLMIDIPIGLPDSGYRGCDLGARKLLSGAESRVFLGLRRPLLEYLSDYPRANAWAKTDGKGLAKHAFAILPKVASVDSVLSPPHQSRFRESHPEVVFWRLSGGTVLPSKHTAEGLKARRDLLLARCKAIATVSHALLRPTQEDCR